MSAARNGSVLVVAALTLLGAAAAAAGAVAGGGEPATTGVADFEGIWKLCYDPGLPNVDEIDAGYLVLMPDGRYYEIGVPCCDPGSPPYQTELGSYTAEEGGIVMHRINAFGDAVEMRLRHVPRAPAVFFDELHGAPHEVEGLTGADDDSLNYAWCRVYPDLRDTAGAPAPARP